jgi:hypothetical protein
MGYRKSDNLPRLPLLRYPPVSSSLRFLFASLEHSTIRVALWDGNFR